MVQVKLAEPVVGASVSVKTGDVAPLLIVAGSVLLQVLPPTVQVTGPEQEALQVAPAFWVAVPLLQVKVEEPVVGAVESVTAAEVAPLFSVPDSVPLQVLPLAVQDTAPVHDRTQVAPGSALAVPALQVKVAVPVVGWPASLMAGDVLPLANVAGRVPLQVLPPTVQETAPEQGGGTVQLAPAFWVGTPLAQRKDAEPVVGAVASVTVAELDPLATGAGSVPVQVLPPTVQLTAPAQLALQVAPLF